MARIGWTVCGCCGNPEASVSETKTGTLSITCHRCEFSAFAKPRTKAQKMIAQNMVRDQDADQDEGADQVQPKTATAKQKVQPKTATAPAVEVKKTTSSVFSLGDL